MIQAYSANIVCDASGDAIVYVGSNIRGRILGVKYTKGTLHDDTDVTLVGDTTALPILTKANLGATTPQFFFPYMAAHKVADGSASTVSEACPFVVDERIKVTVADGGNLGAGSITVYVEESRW